MLKKIDFTHEQPLSTGKDQQDLHFSSPQQWFEWAMALGTGGEGIPEGRKTRFADNFNRQFSQTVRDTLTETNEFLGPTPAIEIYQWAKDYHARPETIKAIHANPVELPPLATEYTDMPQPSLLMEECGMFMDTNAYFMGEELCMVNLAEEPQTKPIVWIGASYGAVHFARQNHFNNRGIALIRAIHALERQSVSVGLFAYSQSNLNGYKAGQANTIVIKQPDQPLSESELVNVLCECGPFRSAGFFTISAGIPSKSTAHCGRMETLSRSRLKGTEMDKHRLVILPYEHDHFEKTGLYSCPEQSTEWVMERIQEQAEL